MGISVVGLIILLAIAALCGAIGRAIAGGTHGGCLVSIALGFIGALIGSWLARRLGLPEVFVTVGRESRSCGRSSEPRCSWRSSADLVARR
jgi:uncharacterized membrane protein YeaQ/YmgE (transglycosylase-associated protein family)